MPFDTTYNLSSPCVGLGACRSQRREREKLSQQRDEYPTKIKRLQAQIKEIENGAKQREYKLLLEQQQKLDTEIISLEAEVKRKKLERDLWRNAPEDAAANEGLGFFKIFRRGIKNDAARVEQANRARGGRGFMKIMRRAISKDHLVRPQQAQANNTARGGLSRWARIFGSRNNATTTAPAPISKGGGFARMARILGKQLQAQQQAQNPTSLSGLASAYTYDPTPEEIEQFYMAYPELAPQGMGNIFRRAGRLLKRMQSCDHYRIDIGNIHKQIRPLEKQLEGLQTTYNNLQKQLAPERIENIKKAVDSRKKRKAALQEELEQYLAEMKQFRGAYITRKETERLRLEQEAAARRAKETGQPVQLAPAVIAENKAENVAPAPEATTAPLPETKKESNMNTLLIVGGVGALAYLLLGNNNKTKTQKVKV